MAANKNAQIAQSVLAAVGGKENIVSVTHCMTRLRFNLKDMSIPKDDEVKAIKGTMGVARSSGQYQVIVGTNVDNVCAELCIQTAQQGAFAAARRADHHDDLAGLDSKADIIQHGGLAIGLDQMFNSQNRFCHVRSLPFLFEIGCQQTDGPAYEEI